MFVFMFGFMIEFVYVRRAEQSGLDSIRRRLYVRSFQCYVGYGRSSLCSLLGGYKGVSQFVGSLAFFGNARFGNILRVYAVILLLTPLLVRARPLRGARRGPRLRRLRQPVERAVRHRARPARSERLARPRLRAGRA